jgi:HprK-related kinase A
MNSGQNWPSRRISIGPVLFNVRTPFASVIADVDRLYRDYPQASDNEVYDFAVSAVPTSRLRRWLRPNFDLECDFEPFEALPMPKRLGMLGLEMGMNLQMAAGYRRHIIVHAAAVERGGKSALIIGDSGAGKSTLSALLAYSGRWRHFGDEFALLDLDTPRLHPFPRPISLKNASIDVMTARAPADRFGPLMEGTVKGTIRHLLPPVAAIEQMHEPAQLAVVIAPHFEAGAKPQLRAMTKTEIYVRLAASSTNQSLLGARGFEAVHRCLDRVRGFDIAYGSAEDALDLFETIWKHTV